MEKPRVVKIEDPLEDVEDASPAPEDEKSQTTTEEEEKKTKKPKIISIEEAEETQSLVDEA